MERTSQQVLDELLALRSQGGDADAFSALVSRWQRRLLRHAYSLTGVEDAAGDVVQETWLAVARCIGRLDDPACFPRWIFQIASRKCADWIRQRQRDREAASHVRPPEPRQERPTSDASDDVARLRAALAKLPSNRRALLAMAYLDGWSIAAIAKALDLPPGTVKSRLFHARQELKDVFERNPP